MVSMGVALVDEVGVASMLTMLVVAGEGRAVDEVIRSVMEYQSV